MPRAVLYPTRMEPVQAIEDTSFAWWHQPEVPALPLPPRPSTGPFYQAEPGVFVEVDDFPIQRPHDNPVLPLPPRPVTGPFYEQEPVLFFSGDIAWWHQPEIPTLPLPPRPLIDGQWGMDGTVFFETFAWWRSVDTPALPLPPRPATGPFYQGEPSLFVEPGEVVIGFLQPSPNPILPPPRLLLNGEYAPEPTLFAPDNLAWWHQPEIPVQPLEPSPLIRGHLRQEPTLFFETFNWWTPTAEPVRTTPPRPLTLGEWGIDPAVFFETFAWWRATEEPVWVVPPTTQVEPPFSLNIEVPAPDYGYVRPQDNPVLSLPRLILVGELGIDATVFETFAWWMPTPEPVRERAQLPIAVRLGAFQGDPDTFTEPRAQVVPIARGVRLLELEFPHQP